MRRLSRIFFLVFGWMVLSVIPALAQPIELNAHDPVRALGASASFMADQSGSLTLSGAQNAFSEGHFEPVKRDHFDAGYSITPHWIVLPVVNTASGAAPFLVSTNIPFIPALSVTLVRDDGVSELLLEKAGETPWRADQFLGQAVVSSIFFLDPSERAAIFIRFVPYGIGVLPLSIETPQTALEATALNKLTLYTFYSFAITSLVLLFLFVIALWHPGGLNFLALFGCGLVMMAQLDGLLNQWVWPTWPRWNKVASFPVLLALCSAGFMTAAFMLRTGGLQRLAHLSRILALMSFLPLLLIPFVEVAWLILVGFVFMVIALGLLTYAVINWTQLLPGKERVALALGVTIFLAVGIILVDVLTGRGNLAAQNLTLVKILYLLITLIIMMSYATHVAALNREHAVSVERELKLARNEARISAELLESERRYAHAQNLVAEQRSRLADASHDLRQPIASLRLSLDSMVRNKDGVVDDTIKRAFDYLDDLVSNHLVESRDDAETKRENPGEVETLEAALITGTVVEMFSEEAAAKGLRLRHVESSALIAVPPMPVMRIVSNLLSNAIKHTSEGRVLIGVRRRGDGISLEIIDTGPGMSLSEIKNLTARYQKGAASEGEGLGLAICYELATENNFKLDISSVVGRGTRFSLEVPAA